MATNFGTANAYPVIRMTGPGRVYEISNITTGETIVFDLELETGEEAVLDLRPGQKKFTSSFTGNIIDTIQEGSDTETFHLMPGSNDISILISDASAVVSMVWEERYRSFDGVVA